MNFPEKLFSAAKSKEKEPVTGVDRWLEEVYGDGSVTSFDALWEKHPEWTLEDAVRGYEKEPMHHQTNFFRLQNLETIAKELVPQIQKSKGEPIEILDIGCATGEEPYSLAVHLLNENIKNFKIQGIDVTPKVVEKATSGEYRVWARSIEELGRDSFEKLKPALFEKSYFVDNGKRWGKGDSRLIVEAGPELRERVQFGGHDILEGAYPGSYDIVVTNHLLVHYPPKSLEKIMAHVLSSLRIGGYLVIEPQMYPRNAKEREWLGPYVEWRKHITEQFPLKEVATHNWGGVKLKTGQFFQLLRP